MKEVENENELALALEKDCRDGAFAGIFDIHVYREKRLKNGKLKYAGYVELMPDTPEDAFDVIKCSGAHRFVFARKIAELLTRS